MLIVRCSKMTKKPNLIENIALKDNDFRTHIGHLVLCDTSDTPDAISVVRQSSMGGLVAFKKNRTQVGLY